ncbi:antibiotic biosynthesis monooxygenase [Erythrobacteraceae bacterium E2-1 Yellow Sea]|nr:antibiotic biosynthesis monooxygenase [Erythrobacteraceae bacterium E2-1 Yellow Sea]
MPEPTGRLHIFATIWPKAEHFAEAKAALEQLVAPTLAEAGCHLFTVLENRDEPGVLHLFEIFEDQAAVAEHYAQDYTKEVFASYQDWLAAPVDIQHLSATSPISAEQFLP